MDWLKKKKEAAKQAAAKLQNKRAPFKGEGNVLGGDGAAAAVAGDAARPPAAADGASNKGLKLPFVKQAPPPVSEEEKERRREMQTKAAEARVNAWDKRVTTARKVRLQQEDELERKFDHLPAAALPLPSSTSSGANSPTSVLSNEEVKRRELESAHAQLGFNPYAPVFASSTEVGSATNAIGGSGAAQSAPMPRPAPYSAGPPASGSSSAPAPAENGAVYVLLRQTPAQAITATETIIKLLNNILQNPQEDKFRRVRLSNASIQTKLVAVPGALDILREAGFSDSTVDGEDFLVLASDQLQSERVKSAVDRSEVALMQLRVDSIGS